ncbi:MAG TPA: hypothetical protein VFG12_11260 [Rhodopila sp.]|nr:hypothetical protein [Rhodopila sp.]
MTFIDSALPAFSDAFVPPIVRGTADLTDFAYQGNGHDALVARIRASLTRNPPDTEQAAWAYDAAIAEQLDFRRAEGLNLQGMALAAFQVFRIASDRKHTSLRLLALAGPGDLMTNTPLDFLTNHLNVRLDLLYILPDRPLPPMIPDHDLAFFTFATTDPATLARLHGLYASWPRPALNDPRFLPTLERDVLSRCLAGIPGLCSPATVAVSRDTLEAHLTAGQPIPGFAPPSDPYPILIRPLGSHAGAQLSRLHTPADLADYLLFASQRQFFVSAFQDYASPDGLYRKYRIAFIARQPYLCHMAVSQHWMVHYLNAGMTESAEKREDEARAMRSFDQGFARRHAAAFAALHDRIGLDYYSIDCAETRDGRLLLFEADIAAIIHLMDPPDLFPYKRPHMSEVLIAFDAMLRRRSGLLG